MARLGKLMIRRRIHSTNGTPAIRNSVGLMTTSLQMRRGRTSVKPLKRGAQPSRGYLHTIMPEEHDKEYEAGMLKYQREKISKVGELFKIVAAEVVKDALPNWEIFGFSHLLTLNKIGVQPPWVCTISSGTHNDVSRWSLAICLMGYPVSNIQNGGVILSDSSEKK